MTLRSPKKIVRLLGVGFDAADGHIRITKGDQYDVWMGSEESHSYLTLLIGRVEEEIGRRGLDLIELQPDDLSKIVQSIMTNEGG